MFQACCPASTAFSYLFLPRPIVFPTTTTLTDIISPKSQSISHHCFHSVILHHHKLPLFSFMTFSINRMLTVIEVLYSSSRLLKSQSRVFSGAISSITNKPVRKLFLSNNLPLTSQTVPFGDIKPQAELLRKSE